MTRGDAWEGSLSLQSALATDTCILGRAKLFFGLESVFTVQDTAPFTEVAGVQRESRGRGAYLSGFGAGQLGWGTGVPQVPNLLTSA